MSWAPPCVARYLFPFHAKGVQLFILRTDSEKKGLCSGWKKQNTYVHIQSLAFFLIKKQIWESNGDLGGLWNLLFLQNSSILSSQENSLINLIQAEGPPLNPSELDKNNGEKFNKEKKRGNF